MKRVFTIVAIVTGWILCGVLAFGITLAFFEQEFPEFEHCKGDQSVAFMIGAFGPLGLAEVYFLSDFANHGIQYTCTAGKLN